MGEKSEEGGGGGGGVKEGLGTEVEERCQGELVEG